MYSAKILKARVTTCLMSQVHLSFIGEEGVTITMPFSDRHNDYIGINVTCCDVEHGDDYRVYNEDVAMELPDPVPEWVTPMLNGNTCELTDEGIAYRHHDATLVQVAVWEVAQCAAQISAGLAVLAHLTALESLEADGVK